MPRKSQSTARKSSRDTTRRTSTTSARRDRANKRNLSDISSTRSRRPKAKSKSKKRKPAKRSGRRRNRLIIVVIGMMLLGYGGVMLGDSLIHAASQINSESFGDIWEKMKTRMFDDDIPRVAPRTPKAPKVTPPTPLKKAEAKAKPLPEVKLPKSARSDFAAPANPADYARATSGETEEVREQEKARARLDRLLGN